MHSSTCPNVVNLLYAPERKIDVEWDAGIEMGAYSVRLKIRVEDRKGLLAELSSRVAEVNTNIRDLEATTDAEHHGFIRMTVEINDLKHLQQVMKSIKKIEGVLDVERAAR